MGAYERAGYRVADPTQNLTLLARTDGVTTRKVTILAGQVLIAGTVIGKITASGKSVKSLAASNDGSQNPDMVLAQDVDASAGDAEAIAYETATVVATALTLGTGHTIDSIRPALRDKGITIDD
ncbi:MAG: head decoration protein [Sphingomonadales bacterium]|nr:head decoration protein [Sphingomonadales bacterium]